MRRLLLASLILCLIVGAAAHGQSLDETARALSKKVAARLGPGEAVHIAARNLTSLPASDLSKAQAAFSRGLRKVGKNVAEVTLTISENVRGYLLVAEVRHEGGRSVDMAPFEAARSLPAELPVIQKSLVWEQDEPILDLAIRGDQMLVLGTASLTRYTRADGVWQRGESRPSAIPQSMPPSRDPRGQIGDGDSFTILAPTNTFQTEGWTPYYSRVHWKNFDLTAEPDGLVHVYDAEHRQVATIDNWGSDVAAVTCGVLATAAVDNAVTVWDIVDRRPRQVSEPLELPGPLTALWPTAGGALAVIKNSGTKKYVAYILTLDCAR